MTSLVGTSAGGQSRAERVTERQVERFAERRAELAAATLQTLSELGYARTSLREIAQNSAFSHGVLHYYFADKVDLITYCVKQYKAHCVTRYDQVIADARTVEEFRTGFADRLAATLREDARHHRLWYDLRNQSLFESAYRADVAEIDASLQAMIWRVLSRYAELAGAAPVVQPAQAYAICDGLFQQALWRHLAGEQEAVSDLRDTIVGLLPRLLA